jgi:hypothetical protein
MINKPKVFCIGFHKTGTTSMEKALKQLGYRVTGGNWVKEEGIGDVVLERALALVPKFDAFQDNPWPILYKELDRAFPGSKFILTMRPPEKWFASMVKNFGTDRTPMREWIYGIGHPEGNEAIYIERYNRHNREVLEYFANRTQDFLLMDLAAGDGWEKLCPFLGVPVRGDPFPHANQAQSKTLKRLWQGMKRKL